MATLALPWEQALSVFSLSRGERLCRVSVLLSGLLTLRPILWGRESFGYCQFNFHFLAFKIDF